MIERSPEQWGEDLEESLVTKMTVLRIWGTTPEHAAMLKKTELQYDQMVDSTLNMPGDDD